MVLAAEKGRLPDLLPLRHGRMVRSAFTFYRGAALTMANDLASTPASGIRVQCCGDAHLCNFGGFATPERKVIFSINDLDETLPAPWEWDVKRLAASFVIACRDNGLRDAVARDVVETCVRSYRESMVELSQMRTLEVWYPSIRRRPRGQRQGRLRPQAGGGPPAEGAKQERRRGPVPEARGAQGGRRSSRTSCPPSSTPRDTRRARSRRPCGT